ncbi:MAG: nicotinate-nicotinamide nucleotide adenylyltransferase [Planctomycetota bacterium]|nr:nicotinate-nicotinamide nucleotide adenylyltransferase [Planctomycetota bacterium]MDA1105985.1 nicotinate-nicotinamide nucleotide adenylyltransferase [Planctomycetota bacterium]
MAVPTLIPTIIPTIIPTLIFGGSFDPPHRRHFEVAFEAARELGCHRLLVVPAARSPLREGSPRFDDATRLAMARAAFEVHPVRDLGLEVRVLDLELRRGGTSFTVDTLRTLTAEFGLSRGTTFLLVGSDQALQFPKWREWGSILRELARLAVVARPPHDVGALERILAEAIPGAPGASIVVLPLEPVDLSSGEIRSRLDRGESIADLVTPEVAAIIRGAAKAS